MIIVVLAVVGLIGILAGVLAARAGARLSAESPSSGFSSRLRIARLSGYALAVATWPLTGVMSYPYADDAGRPGRVAGIPFLVAYFDSQRHDFIGPLSLVGLIGNAAFWGLLPRLIVVCIALAQSRLLRSAPRRGS